MVTNPVLSGYRPATNGVRHGTAFHFPVVTEKVTPKHGRMCFHHAYLSNTKQNCLFCYTAVHSVDTYCHYHIFSYVEYCATSGTFPHIQSVWENSSQFFLSYPPTSSNKTRDTLSESSSDVTNIYNILNTSTLNLNSCNELFYFEGKDDWHLQVAIPKERYCRFDEPELAGENQRQ